VDPGPFDILPRMSEQLSRLGRALTTGIPFCIAVGSAVLIVIWLSRMARGLPDEYPGQIKGGLFLNLYMLTTSLSQLLAKHRMRVPLLVISGVCLVIAMYFVFGTHPTADIHLPRG
jgi:hypothetical protein